MNKTITTIIIAVVMLALGIGVGVGVAKNSQSKNASQDIHHAMASMTSGLEGKTGDDFDKAFIDEMIVHHEGAVAMAEMVLVISKRPELITLAHAIIEAQTEEIQMMEGWKEAWYSNQ